MALWPGTIPAGGQSAYRWAFWDVIPTFLQLAGVHPPPGLDGVSIVPTLLGEPQPPKDFLYWTAKGDMPDPTPEDMVCYATSNPNPDPNSNPNPSLGPNPNPNPNPNPDPNPNPNPNLT